MKHTKLLEANGCNWAAKTNQMSLSNFMGAIDLHSKPVEQTDDRCVGWGKGRADINS